MPLERSQTSFEGSNAQDQRNRTAETQQQRLRRLREAHGFRVEHEHQVTDTPTSQYQYSGQFPPTRHSHYSQSSSESWYIDPSTQRNSNNFADPSYQHNPHYDTSQQLRERGPEWTQELGRDRANYTHLQEERSRLEFERQYAERQLAMDTSFNTMLNRVTSLNEEQAYKKYREWRRENIPRQNKMLQRAYKNRIKDYLHALRLQRERSFNEMIDNTVSLNENQARGIYTEWLLINVPQQDKRLLEEFENRINRHCDSTYW
jgi:hypothetical protein